MYDLIMPLGIINLLLVLIQILGGMKIVKVSYKAHRFLGYTLGVFALLHGVIAFLST